jgi:DUF1680 family protein
MNHNPRSFAEKSELDRTMDYSIEVIAKAQAPDGYISTQIQLTDVQRWQDLKYERRVLAPG